MERAIYDKRTRNNYKNRNNNEKVFQKKESKRYFFKKILSQMIWSIIIFIGFYLIKDLNHPYLEKFKNVLKYNLNYNVDLKEISQNLTNFLPFFAKDNIEKASICEETKEDEELEEYKYLRSSEI
ncbi:MAG: hypothetical protein LBJ09_00345 [Clostridiales bacterium]|jgi:hypothetical protein|nr:hypothetical protein [Clostridiales bacterium]